MTETGVRGRAAILLAVLWIGIHATALAQESRSAPDSRPVPSAQLEIEKNLRRRLGDPNTPLDIELLTLGDEFSGFAPADAQFDVVENRLYFRRRPFDADEVKTYRFDPRSGELLTVDPDAAEERPLFDRDLVWNAAMTEALFVRRGDIHRFTVATRRIDRLTDTVLSEFGPRYAADGRGFIYEANGEWFYRAFDGSLERQLTLVRGGDAGEAAAPRSGRGRRANESSGERPASAPAGKPDRARYLADEERGLLRRVYEEDLERTKARPERTEGDRLERFVPPDGFRVDRVLAAPDLNSAAVIVKKGEPVPRATDVPNYIARDGYVFSEKSRPKVGDRDGESDLFVLDTRRGEKRRVRWPIDGPFDVTYAEFSPTGKTLIACAESFDQSHAVIVRVDIDRGVAEPILRIDDAAWVYHVAEAAGFLPGSDRFWFTAEADGFVHLYAYDGARSVLERLTDGLFEVRSAAYDPRRRAFLVHTSEASPFETHAYLIPAEGGGRQRITSDVGIHRVTSSPDGEWIADIFSTSNRPPEVYVRRVTESGRVGLCITKSPSPAFLSREWPRPEIVRFTARDGVRVPMRLYRPKRAAPSAPAVVFVHGAGYLQNVHEGWSRYSREYMFHTLLASEGYHVIDIDYRGSAGYGRTFRTANYRHMGSLDLTDQVDGVKWLVENCGVDPKRVGIYGGSYGGFITLMAMFTTPDVFAAGAALRPVTDWAHYNHGYTSSILNEPTEDAEAYRRSSPIYFAEGLKGRLLICHGVIDDNVEFQDSVRLVQRLIELRKRNFELAVYPTERHAFTDPASWADEYTRIRRLFKETLER